MTPFAEEWSIVKNKIEDDFRKTRNDYEWVKPFLAALSLKDRQLGVPEQQEYLDECLCAFVEALVLRLTEKKNLVFTG